MADADEAPILPQCTFALNNQPFSALICNGIKYQAFSGDTDGKNNPDKAAVPNTGPIPPGFYYIVDRPRGGRFPWLEAVIHDLISDSDRVHWLPYTPKTRSAISHSSKVCDAAISGCIL